jgi:hypothetical protein
MTRAEFYRRLLFLAGYVQVTRGIWRGKAGEKAVVREDGTGYIVRGSSLLPLKEEYL